MRHVVSTAAGTRRASSLPFVAALTVVVVMFAAPLLAHAQDNPTPPEDGVTDDDVNAVSKDLYCPVCENVPLDVCGTQACADWRAEIREMLAEGQSPDEIKAAFAARYGQRVLATPQASGFNLLVWVLPPLAALIGLGVLVAALTRMRPRRAASPAAALRYDDLDPEYLARIERDLRDMRA